jgi:subtilisin family serine protease
MRNLLMLCVAFMIWLPTRGQEVLFLTPKGQIALTISKQYAFVMTESPLAEALPFAGTMQLAAQQYVVPLEAQSVEAFAKQHYAKKNWLVMPVLETETGNPLLMKGEIIVKLSPKQSIQELIKEIGDYQIAKYETWQFDPQVYILQTAWQDIPNTLTISNLLQSSGKVLYAEPNFSSFKSPSTTPNDPLYPQQWALNNPNNQLAAISAPAAWNISTGFGVKVAVLDDGVQLNHPDLAGNLLAGYDATGGNNGGNTNGFDGHGTACAGIIAAKANNGLGATGLAYNAKIIPIRIFYTVAQNPLNPLINRIWETNLAWNAAGIRWAASNGADVISCSWQSFVPSSLLDDAIVFATSAGNPQVRNGKGCVLVSATANENIGTVAYPARLPQVIAVGANTPCATRKNPSSCDGENWWGSNFGTGIDVMAPGVLIPTTDLLGSRGYDDVSDYTVKFNGTSSAAPQVSGIAALILSINPNLYSHQVKQIIEKTAKKSPSYNFTMGAGERPDLTWNSEMGYGIVDARAAVCEVAYKNFNVYAGSYIYSSTVTNNQTSMTTCAAAPLTIIPTQELWDGQWTLQINGQVVSQQNSSVAYFITPPQNVPYFTITYTGTTECGVLNYTFHCYNQDCGIFAIYKNGETKNFSAYPNPANSTLNLSFENPSQSPVRLLLSNALGVVVLENKEINLDSNQKTSIDLSILPEGIYILQVQYADGSIATQKIAVQRGEIKN